MGNRGRPKVEVSRETVWQVRAMSDGQKSIRYMCAKTGLGNTVIRRILRDYENEIKDAMED